VIHTYHFDNYYNWQPWEINRELAGVENLKERIAKNDIPDSYIMGNSRSFVYRCTVWEPFLPHGAKAFHLDAASETLFGVCHKVSFLDRENIKAKNILWICDATFFPKTENEYDITHIKYPDISGESKFSYQTNFIKGYFTNFFFLKQMDFMLTGKVKNYMQDIFAIKPGYVRTEPYHNDFFYQRYDSLLAADSLAYYNVYKKEAFEERPKEAGTINKVILSKQIEMLKEMKRILDKNNTSMKIVISPVYDQRRLNPEDIKILTDIFGPNVIHDYSGKNEITESKANYYESNHYKPFVANKIMADIYPR
jgi:hypothetical protein